MNVIVFFLSKDFGRKVCRVRFTVITFDELMYDYFMCVIYSFGGRVQTLGGILWLKNFILTDRRVGGI